jgi:hypothetical protein
MFRGGLGLWIHPLVGFATIALAAWAASLGLRSRSARRTAPSARRRHRRLAPVVWALVAANWLGGLGAVWWFQPDLEPAASGHFTVGSLIVVLLTGGAILSRWVPVDTRARTIHPILGAAALLLCGVQIFLGLQILP